MPSSSSSDSNLQSQPEKPHHYTYLKEFRTQQCQLFLQHKCTQHRPYTCFNWHFANQRRRRPVRKREGTFNYSPDVYCNKYDETTGLCPNGEECPLLHRTAGDTERRYHLRYYKTASCVHETDSKGACTKNGAHCAFAHGTQDLRQPTFDVREIQGLEQEPESCAGADLLSSSLEREKTLNDDPKWNDTNYVLANYKTEQCKRPPRLCRQGYACPQFHNNRDRRRNPKKFKYRSTPCPQVKHSDEWGDPAICDNGDHCQYCHTRTEQQFHPEIYKSTKCNDMVQTGYCPRGPFCAFAHVEQEMQLLRENVDSTKSNSLAAFIPSSLKLEKPSSQNGERKPETDVLNQEENNNHGKRQTTRSLSSSFSQALNSPGNHVPEPIGKGRSSSISDNRSVSSDRDDVFGMRCHMSDVDSDSRPSSLSSSLIGAFNNNINNSGNNPSMSPFAQPFFPSGDTVESVIGNAMEDFTLEEFNLSFIDKEDQDPDRDNASVSSSLSAGFSSCLGTSISLPMSIPDSVESSRVHGSIGSLSQSPPPCSPLGSLPIYVPQQQSKANSQLDQSHSAFLNQPKYQAVSNFGSDLSHLISPRSVPSVSNSLQSPSTNGHIFYPSNTEVQRLREEANMYKAKLHKWEEGMTQARGACEAWKREMEETLKRMRIIEEEKKLMQRQRDEAIAQAAQMKRDLERIVHSKQSRISELVSNASSSFQLRQVQQQLRSDLDKIETLLSKQNLL